MSSRQPAVDVSGTSVDRRQWRAATTRAPRARARQVAEFQRSRLLWAATAVACEHGYDGITAAAVVARAGTSRKTFYDLFENSDDCFLAVLDDALERLVGVVVPAYDGESRWVEQLRAALIALLGFLEDEPELGALILGCVSGCPPAGGELRRRVLESLHAVVERGRLEARVRDALSPLTAEAIVGGVLAVVHERVRTRPHALSELVNPLMWMIVLPYLGPAAAGRQLTRATRSLGHVPAEPVSEPTSQRPPNMRLTYRTSIVLEAIAHAPGSSNARISTRVGIADQGQMSKLLGRLARLGLVENTGLGQAKGAANAWSLTATGAELELALRRRSRHSKSVPRRAS
jgi:AcrR family transcriptional regulator